MLPKRIWPIGVALLFLAIAATALLWSSWPSLLLAQDDSDTAVQPKLYLPMIFTEGNASLPSEEETQGDSDSSDNGDGHTHDHGQAVPLLESWPPQPVGITEVTFLVPQAGEAIAAAQEADDQAEAIALASPAVQAALGITYVHAATIHRHGKDPATAAGKEVAEVRVAYFSYTNNATVEVAVAAGKVASVQSVAAATYQPEPTRQERVRAIELARDYFLAEGESRVNELHGFVIMAYRPQGATGFYDSRVLYVTFHQSLDERPEYLAWVDLSHETILKAVVETFEQTSPADITTRQAGGEE